jgi:processive 1,2-diacylglycerol beta-glucosyltransferase
MGPRILILHASVGAGHARAAEALELTAKQLLPGATVVCKDVLDLSNRLFRRLYGKSYLDMVNKTPHLLGFMYDWLDRPSRRGKEPRGGDRIRLAIEKMNLRPFLRLLHSQPWDLVLNTHFLPAEIIASLRKKGTFQTPQVTVVTDFDTHRLWVNQPCDHYYTASEEGRQYLCSWGIPPETTSVTGIPIHPGFSEETARADLLAKYGLVDGPPVILQMAGGYGVGPIEQIYRSLLAVDQPVQILAVSGRNETKQ